MPRIKLQELANYPYWLEIPVRITDINYGGHLGNDSMVSIIHEARFRFVQNIGFNNEIEAGMIMADLVVQFKAESFCDDKLIVGIAVGEISKSSFRIFYKAINSEKKLITLAETGIVFIDYSTRKIISVPEKFTAFMESIK